MSIGDYLSLAGIVVSLVFGGWGVYLVLRRGTYPAKLSFVCDQSVSLMEDFVSKLPNLKIQYRDVPIDANLLLLSGYVVNNGSVDITESMTEHPLSCVFPDGCEVLEFQVRATALDLKVESEIISENSVAFRLGLFRRDESFHFQALVSVEPKLKSESKKFFESIVWRHRIAGLGSVRSLMMPGRPKIKNIRMTWIRSILVASFVIFYAFLGFSQLTDIGPLGNNPSIAYKLVRDGSESLVKLIPKKGGMALVKNLNSGESVEVDLAEFTSGSQFTPVYTNAAKEKIVNRVLGAFMILAALFMLYIGFGDDYKRMRLKKLVSACSPRL